MARRRVDLTWAFPDPGKTAVFTSVRVIDGEEWIYYVSHDADDGSWQFHPYSGPTPMEEARVVGLREIVAMEPRLAELADLPLGWHAWCDSPEAEWQRAKQEGQVEKRSRAGRPGRRHDHGPSVPLPSELLVSWQRARAPGRSMNRGYRIMDTVILVLCLPFYAVVIPWAWVHDRLRQRRRVRLGQEVTHWPLRDVREDYVVVDVSRQDEGLVGICRRRWNLLGRRGQSAPPYREQVEYIRRERFWVTRPFRFRGDNEGGLENCDS